MQVEDAWRIQSLVQLYGIAVDARRFALFETIFMPDARFDYFGRRWDDRGSFMRDFTAAHKGYGVTQHAMTNHVAVSTGDGAAALTYCHWRLAREDRAWWGVAWYDDRCVRQDEEWRIASRRCELLWSEGDPMVAGAAQVPAPLPLHLHSSPVFGKSGDG